MDSKMRLHAISSAGDIPGNILHVLGGHYIERAKGNWKWLDILNIPNLVIV